ncbi:hypothetical protein Tco_0741132 [Tanacetum coccineum]
MEVSRLSRIDNDLFTYDVEVANIQCNSKMDDDSKDDVDDDMGYDPSDVTFIEWLGSKIFNYKTMDQYTMKALWIYWIRGNNEVELTDEESSDDDDDEIAKVHESKELCEGHELPVCNIRKFMMIKYSFNNDEEYVAIKEDEYGDLTITRKEAGPNKPYQIRREVPKLAAISSKRDAEEELNQGSSERQKTSENSEPTNESKEKEDDELSQEEPQQLIIIVLEEGMNVEALQTKYPIIDWDVYTKDSRMYWKIIRVGNHTKRLYDTCGVHHVSTKDGIDIYMLVEKEYPLSRGVLTQMLAAKLLVEQNNEMSRELLRKIFMMAERPRSTAKGRVSTDKLKGINKSVQANVINEVKNFLPKFLPKAVKDALEKTLLPFAQSSSPDQSEIKAVESLSEYELKNILYTKMHKSQSHLTHDTNQELYDALTW